MGSTDDKVLSSKIDDYKRDKKTLTPPFGQLQMSQVMWHKELLPDFLWIDSLVAYYGDIEASRYYNRLLDALDNYHNVDPILTGTISDFGLFTQEDQKLILENNRLLIEDSVVNPFGNIINIYPECPMKWLADGIINDKSSITDAIEEVKKSVIRLYPAKDNHGGLVRALPLNRFFKHKKIQISSKLEDIIAAIEQYPSGDRRHVEAFARSFLNGYYMNEREKHSNLEKWSKYFWTYNYAISKCEI